MGRRLGWLWTERGSVGALLPSSVWSRSRQKSGYKGQRNGGQQTQGVRDRVADRSNRQEITGVNYAALDEGMHFNLQSDWAEW